MNHTGYPADFVELDQDLEGELGIDTVKQAEIMADIRAKFGLPVDEDFVLSDYPTLNHMIAYIHKMQGGTPAVVEAPAEVAAPEPVAAAEPQPAPVEAPAATVVEAPSGGAEDIQPRLIGVVVKHTGYPEDFIEMDQDLEGELGIDTVKQAEIMGDVREIFSLPVDEDFVLSEHPTLNHFVAYIQKMTGGVVSPAPAAVETVAASPAPEVAAPEPQPAPSAPAATDSGDIQPKLIGVVVKHTGYPEDFIEMDQDLEGELGIDTVKQAEIMGDVREIFSLPVDEDFVLSDHPTLNHFVSYIVKMKGGGTEATPAPAPVAAPIPAAPVVAETPPQSTSTTSTTRRWQVEVEPCPAMAEGLPIGGTIVITQDSWGVADALAQRLADKGLSVAKVGFEFGAKAVTEQEELSGHTYRADPGSEEQIADMFKDLGVGGIIHLAPLSLTGSSWESEGASNQVNLAAQSWLITEGLNSRSQQQFLRNSR